MGPKGNIHRNRICWIWKVLFCFVICVRALLLLPLPLCASVYLIAEGILLCCEIMAAFLYAEDRSLVWPVRLCYIRFLPALFLPAVFRITMDSLQSKGLSVLFFVLFHGIFIFYLLICAAGWREGIRFLRSHAGKLAGLLLGIWAASAFLFLVGSLLLAGGIRIFCDAEIQRMRFQLCFLFFQHVWTILYRIALMLCVFGFYCGKRVRCRLRGAAAVLAVSLCGAVLCGWMLPTCKRVIAHRAGAAFAPENTVSALQLSGKAGFYMAEIDVQQLKDGTLIVMHDTDFMRNAGSDITLREAAYEWVRSLDVGTSFSRLFAEERIPTLAELLSAAKGRIRLMIELKAGGYPEGLPEQVLRLVDAYGMREACVIASMNSDLLQRVEALEPAFRTVYISESWQALPDFTDAYSMKAELLSAARVNEIHAQGKEIYAWTVNSERKIRRYLRYGIDGLISDNPVLTDFCSRGGNSFLPVEGITELLFPLP